MVTATHTLTPFPECPRPGGPVPSPRPSPLPSGEGLYRPGPGCDLPEFTTAGWGTRRAPRGEAERGGLAALAELERGHPVDTRRGHPREHSAFAVTLPVARGTPRPRRTDYAGAPLCMRVAAPRPADEATRRHPNASPLQSRLRSVHTRPCTRRKIQAVAVNKKFKKTQKKVRNRGNYMTRSRICTPTGAAVIIASPFFEQSAIALQRRVEVQRATRAAGRTLDLAFGAAEWNREHRGRFVRHSFSFGSVAARCNGDAPRTEPTASPTPVCPQNLPRARPPKKVAMPPLAGPVGHSRLQAPGDTL